MKKFNKNLYINYIVFHVFEHLKRVKNFSEEEVKDLCNSKCFSTMYYFDIDAYHDYRFKHYAATDYITLFVDEQYRINFHKEGVDPLWDFIGKQSYESLGLDNNVWEFIHKCAL